MLVNRGWSITLMVAGVLALIGSNVAWVTCATTPCSGSLMSISTYSGLSLGYGVLAAIAGAVMVIIGIECARHLASPPATPALLLGALVLAAVLLGVVDAYVDPNKSLTYTILLSAAGGVLSVVTGARIAERA